VPDPLEPFKDPYLGPLTITETPIPEPPTFGARTNPFGLRD
jgi:hypothetical protein